ncbi:MAG: chlorosome envelope protein H [Chlorobium sp.]|jgi:chlorosome envelope protein H|uniref:chlorosome envelope protein H n=1 Tax=Chlorobium sp. TaxID=1095 RepID=UPI001D59CBEF|nr:chlorosome envelope protein H [Chlorobium sp.]MBN1278407.1 chlorosome envelope protein H [Chlorobiaceae bacterium]MCF8216610.1 chlorosome envelope protein H [Chlorobium sp.]MCF8271480.1 chlorosome envelope protein H [Chlorobium sp.]MCF8287852.1 chlorosome envelope protein H [Chlorobium sp.]MCF8291364.1 chlorosome envelope protein H [Chlorobium sp.]
MAAEELNKPATKPAAQQDTGSNVGNGDMANLIGNMGILIDSTIESVQGMISSVSSATGQIIEGVNSTINSEPVKKIFDNVNSVSGQLIEGVTATLKSEQVQTSVQEIGKLWKNLLESLNNTVSSVNETVSSGQVQNLFENVSAGLGQLAGNIFSPGMGMMYSGGEDKPKKEVKEIPFSQKAVSASVTEPKAAETPKVSAKP